MKSVLFVFGGLVIPAFGQYGGPAVLSRGEAPSAMTSPEISFRPFLGLGGTYITGLGGVRIDNNGAVPDASSFGERVSWGIGGSKSWRHTKVGLDYRGAFSNYSGAEAQDYINQSLLLGITQQLSSHVFVSLRENAGIFTRDDLSRGLQQTVPFDPATTYVPTTDYFDNRTYYTSTQADLRIQKTYRLSFDLGGDVFSVRRSAKVLYGSTGAVGRGDMQYRVSRFVTIGAGYGYQRYWFSHIYGGTNAHMAQGTIAVQLSRLVEFSAAVGAARVESVFAQAVPVPPEIALLLGITSGTRVVDQVSYHPNTSARISRTFQHGVLSAFGGQGITPGNGLFLTSTTSTIGAGYGYTGLRRWSLNTSATYGFSRSLGYIGGHYRTANARVSLSRSLIGNIHLVLSGGLRKYSSPDFDHYNRSTGEATLGLGWTPGDIPLRVW